MTASLTHRILSKDNSPLVLLARIVLAPLQLVYMLLSSAKNAVYDGDLMKLRSVDVPEISV